MGAQKKANMFKAKKTDRKDLKQVLLSSQQTIPDHRLNFPYSSKNSSAEHIHALSTWQERRLQF